MPFNRKSLVYMEVTILESQHQKLIIKTIQGAQGGSSSFQTGIAFIALLVGAVGIITTLYTSVNERIKEIGTMKAIGAKSRFILALFLSEALIIGLLGSTLGLINRCCRCVYTNIWHAGIRRRRREDHPDLKIE